MHKYTNTQIHLQFSAELVTGLGDTVLLKGSQLSPLHLHLSWHSDLTGMDPGGTQICH